MELEELDIADIGGFSDQEHMHASFRTHESTYLTSFREEMDAGLVIQEAQEGEDSSSESKDKEEEPEKDEPLAHVKRPKQRRRSSLLKKTLLKTFTNKEEKTVFKVLKQINEIESRQYKQGFKEVNFTFGVMNCFLVAYLFGAHPEHFWLVYLVESLYYIPLKFWNMISARPLNQALYYFDFCWMMNFNAILCLVLVASPIPLPPTVRQFVFRGSFGIACGPLLGATLLLPFVAFVFHDINTMCNVVIHALPPMMLYTLRWHGDEVSQAWPQIFKLQGLHDPDYFPNGGNPFFMPGTGLGSVAGNAVLMYIMWWVPYTSWMLLMGLDLPRKDMPSGRTPQFDTVFHSFWRSGHCAAFGSTFWKRPVELSQQQMENDHYEARDFLLYMGIHAFLVSLSIPTLGFACNYSKASHMAVMCLVLLAVVHRGSQRYTYYTTKMYSRIIKKEFIQSEAAKAAS